MYVVTGTQLRRYNTATDSFADTGDFPYSWTTLNAAGAWLQLNLDETRATAILVGGTSCTSLDLTTGDVITQSPVAIGELYISGDVAFIESNPDDQHWDLAADVVSALDIPDGWQWLVHTATPDGFAFHSDLGAGGGIMPSTRILDSNVAQPTINIQGYWSGKHSCGHWQDFPAGTVPHILQSNNGLGIGHTASWESSIIFINTLNADKRLLGHHYSILNGYWTNAFANQSHDGKLVGFTSNMNDSAGRTDYFVMEVPRT